MSGDSGAKLTALELARTEPPETSQRQAQLADELRQLRAKRAELAQRRAEQEAAAELENEVAAEQRALRDEQAIADAIEQHGPLDKAIATVETTLGTIIVKRASSLKFRRFQDKEAFTTEDVMQLIRPCVVHPPLAELDDWLEEQPGALARIGSAVARLAGVRQNELAKK